MARTNRRKGYTQELHVIKSGETRKQVADRFGVSVQELLEYNSAVLGDRWDAGKVVRDPKHKEKKVKEAIERGATAEQLARALNMSVDDVVSEYNVFREDELQDAPKPTKKLKETLKEIEIPKRAGKIDEVEVPDREKREVVLKKKEPEENPVEQYLANIIVPQRAGRFPEVEVPRRSGRFPEVEVPRRSGRYPLKCL